MSLGSDVGGGRGTGVRRWAGRGTAEGSGIDGRGDSAALGLGDGVLAGSAFSIRFGFGVGVGLFFPFTFFFLGVGDSSASGLGLFFAAGVLPGSGDSAFSVRFGFGVASSSSPVPSLADFGLAVEDSSASGVGLLFARGVLVGSGVSVAFGFAFALDFGVGLFLAFAFLVAGFGFEVGDGVSLGAGEVIARISSRALRASCFFFSSSVWAWTKVAMIAPRASAVPRKTRKRITAGEANRDECVIKRAVAPPPEHARRVLVRVAEWRSVFRPAAKTNRSNTSRS